MESEGDLYEDWQAMEEGDNKDTVLDLLNDIEDDIERTMGCFLVDLNRRV